jgi:hypothetical protein
MDDELARINKSLPRSWEARRDPQTGRVYYLDHQSKVRCEANDRARLERPLGVVQEEILAPHTLTAGSRASQKTQWAPPPGAAPVTSPATSAQPAVVQNVGRQSYNIYLPDGARAATPPQASAAADLDSIRRTLPAGWTCAIDPRNNRVYFLNNVKKTTTWIRPTRPASEDEGAPGAAQQPSRVAGNPYGSVAAPALAAGGSGSPRVVSAAVPAADGGGGSPRAVPVTEMYKTVVQTMLMDGKMTAIELRTLAKLRETKGISDADHENVLRELGVTRERWAEMVRKGSDDAGDEESNKCVICLDETRTHAFLNCMHKCVCKSCGEDLKRRNGKCPICRQPIVDVRQVFG